MAPAHESPPRRQHLHALLLALLCSVLFLRDGLLPGRALVPYPPEQMDVARAEAAAKGLLDPHDARRGLSSGGDKYLQSLCWDRVLQDRFARGELPRWTRDIGGGAPFVPQMAQVYEPINLLLFVLPSEQWYGWWFLVHQVLFGYFAWLFLRRLGCLHGSALLGLTAAVLGLWTQCKLHHNVILTAALSLWPMLSAVHALCADGARGRARAHWTGWLALWTGLSWLSGFAVVSLQVTYLAGGFALLLVLRRPRGERLRALLPVGVGLGLGALLSLAHMLPVLQAAAVSARDSSWNPAFLAAHGLEWDHAMTALWPDLLSWPSDAFYADAAVPSRDATRLPWSQLVLLAQPLSPATGSPFQSWVETSFAVGTAPLALAALALFDRARRAAALGFAAVGLAAFALATADQPFLALARFVPGIASADLRRMLFTVAMALVVLAALGADALAQNPRRWPALAVLAFGAVAAALARLWLAGHAGEGEFVPGIAQLIAADRDHAFVQEAGGDAHEIGRRMAGAMATGECLQNELRLATTALRAMLVCGTAAVAALLLRGRLQVTVLVVVTVCELLHAGLGPVQTVPAERIATPPAVVAPVFAAAAPNGERPRLQRLLPTDDNRPAACYPANLPGYHGLEDAAGYNPLPPARYEEFFTAIEPDRKGKANVAFGGAGVGAFHDPASLQHPLCDLFGIRFVVTALDVPLGPQLIDRTPPGTGGFRLLERTTTLLRATFVREVDVLPDRQARLAVLSRADRDVRTRVVLEDEQARRPTPGDAPPATVTLVEHRDERVVVRVASEADGYLRLADPYDQGWRATVDGTGTEVLPADHYLRAVYVPAGDREVVFTYDGPRVVWPLRLSFVSLLAILALLVGLPRRRP